MKTQTHCSPRAAWLFLAAPALLAVPAFAQDALTAPPPVRVTVPQASVPASPPAPAPVVQAAPQVSDTPAPATASRTTIAPGAADVVDDARRPVARAARPAPVRQAARTSTPVRSAPVAAPAPVAVTPAPVATTSAPEVVTPAPEPAPVADSAQTETATTTTTEDKGPPLWPIALIAALIVAAGAFFLMRRRRADTYTEDTYYEAEPVAYVESVVQPAYVAPIAAAPIVEPIAAGLIEEPTVSDAPAEDVAALTDGAPPVRNRPWLEFAMRPVRAGTSADEALVEIELTVANSGTVEATDVRVSTFMLTDAHASEMERMMVDAPADAAIDPVNIAPGEGTRIDATLAALKSDLGTEGHFNPVVIAEARYRLPDGSEGRTAASFVVGVSDADGGAMTPIDLADRVMREDIEAHLHGEVEHA